MARMITAPGIIRNVNKYLNSMRKVPFAIGVDDWEAVTGGFQAPFLSQYVTASSFEIGTYNDSIKAAESGINFEKNGLGTGLTFFCEVKPTATISGDLYVFDNNDGKVPVILEDTVIDFENGGHGASTLAGAQENLQIGNPATLTTTVKTDLVSAVNELNSNITWTKYFENSYAASTFPEIDLPSSWSELNVVIEVGSASDTFSFQVVKALTQVGAVFRQGFYVSSNDWARAHFKYKTGNKIQVTDAQINGSNYGYTVRIASR